MIQRWVLDEAAARGIAQRRMQNTTYYDEQALPTDTERMWGRLAITGLIKYLSNNDEALERYIEYLEQELAELSKEAEPSE